MQNQGMKKKQVGQSFTSDDDDDDDESCKHSLTTTTVFLFIIITLSSIRAVRIINMKEK